jgi:CubicO group peptidase (beta-lactamase class C family)
VHRRNLLLLPIAHPALAAEVSAPGNPFAGLDETIATDASDVGSVVVVRDHRLLFEYCKGGADPDALRNVQSVTKSVVSMAVGAAIGQGVLSSVDQSVPELVARIGTLSERAAGTKLTLRHLLAMTAGFAAAGRVTRKQSDDPVFLLERERAAEPGTRFFYDNHASNLLAATLELAIGVPMPEFAQANLFGPLGIPKPEWETGPNGHAYGASGLRLRTRDMALLGQLMLEQGSWHGSRLLPTSFVAEATAVRGAGSAPYGYGWWVRPGQAFDARGRDILRQRLRWTVHLGARSPAPGDRRYLRSFRAQPGKGPCHGTDPESTFQGGIGVAPGGRSRPPMKTQERDALLQSLKARFEGHMHRHKGVAWADVQARLDSHPEALKSLRAMEATNGEPDVIGHDKKSGRMVFCDCSAESPAGRRSLCYDREALDSRKENKPQGSAVEMAVDMGIELLTEAQYRALQELGEFDVKTSSWIRTDPEVRALGGALFCDRRYGRVFVYHNGAQSYYAARGFRGMFSV